MTSTSQPDLSTSTPAASVVVPDKPALEGLEEKWSRRWQDEATYAFDRTQPRENVFSIDTPPPTVSGSLHVGHVFSYTHPDLIARFQRMRGKTIFYPMGWDDNGLPTERRVQNYYGVRCDPSLPFEPDFTPPEKPDPKKQVPVSRPNFIALCEQLVEQDEAVFEVAVAHAGALGGLEPALHDDRARGPGGQPARLPAQPRARRGLPPGGAHAVGRHLPDRGGPGRAEGPGVRRRLPPRRLPRSRRLAAVHRDDPARAHPQRRGADRPPRRRALPGAVRDHRDLAGLRCRDPGGGAPGGRDGQGLGPGHVLHLRRPHRRHVVARARPPGADRDRPRRSALARDPPVAERRGRPRRPTASWRARPPSRPGRRWSPRCARPATSTASPRPRTRMANFYENGDKPLEIVATRQWYITNGGRDAALRTDLVQDAGPSSGPRPTCAAATRTGWAASTATG